MEDSFLKHSLTSLLFEVFQSGSFYMLLDHGTDQSVLLILRFLPTDQNSAKAKDMYLNKAVQQTVPMTYCEHIKAHLRLSQVSSCRALFHSSFYTLRSRNDKKTPLNFINNHIKLKTVSFCVLWMSLNLHQWFSEVLDRDLYSASSLYRGQCCKFDSAQSQSPWRSPEFLGKKYICIFIVCIYV